MKSFNTVNNNNNNTTDNEFVKGFSFKKIQFNDVPTIILIPSRKDLL